MKLIPPNEPEWTVELADAMAEDYSKNLGKRKHTSQSQREFATKNLGSMGKRNISNVDMKDFYPGKDHLGMREVEALCLRIGHVAKGKYHFYCNNLHAVNLILKFKAFISPIMQLRVNVSKNQTKFENSRTWSKNRFGLHFVY
jgi:hypothetical protein